MRHLALLALAWLGLGLPGMAAAHPLAPARLTLSRDAGSDAVVVEWKTPLRRPAGFRLEPIPPAICGEPEVLAREVHADHRLERFRLACRSQDLAGETLRVAGLETSGGAVLVDVALPGIERERVLLHAGQQAIVLARRAGSLARLLRWTRLGLAHIAGGFDHLLFVGTLALLLADRRKTVIAITGFSLGHTVTLAVVGLGGLSLPSRPVEIAIAGSLLWMAIELERSTRRPAPGFVERRPFFATAAFGLLHGLGFAGAFRALDVTTGSLAAPLLGFNLGVELGQCAFLVLAASAHALGRALLDGRLPGRARADLAPRSPSADRLPSWVLRNAVGALSAFWLIERTLA